MFLNILTAEYKYSRRNMPTFAQPVQTPLTLKQKLFSRTFIRFSKLNKMENIFKKKESLLV